MTIDNITTIENAIETLANNNVTYDKVLYLDDPTVIHYYFLNGNLEMAYFTPQLNRMKLHATGKEWSQEDIDSCAVYTQQ